MPSPYVSPRFGAIPGVVFRKSKLSRARQRLIDLLGAIHFGRINNLQVKKGEPVFDPPPVVIRTLKISGKNGPHPEASHPDYLLKEQMLELLLHLDNLGDGVINRLEIAHGLPFLLEVMEAPAA